MLPVDARPAPITFPDGVKLGNRRQPFRRDLRSGGHRRGDLPPQRRSRDGSVAPGIPVFDDTNPNKYWSSANPWNSVKVAGTGTSMTVTNTRDGGNELQVHVAFAG